MYLVDGFEDMTGPKEILLVTRTKGVTFGNLLDDMQPKDVSSGNNGEENKYSIRISASLAIPNDDDAVKIAREARGFDGLQKLDTNQAV